MALLLRRGGVAAAVGRRAVSPAHNLITGVPARHQSAASRDVRVAASKVGLVLASKRVEPVDKYIICCCESQF